MSKLFASLVVAFAVTACQSPGTAQTGASDKIETRQRQTAERPTALPEDKDLASQFARSAAGYTTQIRILRAAGRDPGKLPHMANWLYFNAIDLSDEAFAKNHFTKHLKELSDLNETANRAASSGNRERLEPAINALTARINQRLEEGERLFAKYGKTFNTVVQNSDGSFTIQSQ